MCYGSYDAAYFRELAEQSARRERAIMATFKAQRERAKAMVMADPPEQPQPEPQPEPKPAPIPAQEPVEPPKQPEIVAILRVPANTFSISTTARRKRAA